MVMIAGATGLRNADWSPFSQDKSDPYCVCKIEDRPDVKIRTATVNNSLEPVWNHVERIESFKPGEALTFIVWDADVGKKDDKLGNIRMDSSMFLPHGFVGKLNLQSAGNTTAAIYVAVLPMPICSGVLDVMRMGSLEPRFFSLSENSLLYFTDRSDYETGAAQRGSIMLTDVERFDVDKNGTLRFHIYRSPQPIQVHCRSWEEAATWGAGVDRALLMRGFSSEKELPKLAAKVPIREGHLRLGREGADGSQEEHVYIALFSDNIIGYQNYLTFRNNARSSLWAEPLEQVSRVASEADGTISLAMAGKVITLHTTGWEDSMRWGSGFVQALEHSELDKQGSDKVDWPSFLMMVLCEGSLDIVRGSGSLPRYFVLYGDHMAYFNSKEEYQASGKQHGSVELQHVTKVLLGNEIVLTIKLVNGSVFQLRELSKGDTNRWATAWDRVLKSRGLPGVLRYDSGDKFGWDFLTAQN